MSEDGKFIEVKYKKKHTIETQISSQNNNSTKIKILKKEISVGQCAIGKYKKEIEKLKAQISTLSERNLELIRANKFLKEDNTTLKEDNTTLKEDNTTLKEDNTTLKEDNTTLKEDNTTLKEDKIELEINIKTERENNFDLNKDNSNLSQKLNYEKRHLHHNYQSPTGDIIKKKIYIIDISKINIPYIDVNLLFNNEYTNLFTYGHFHWALPKGKRIGDIVIIKNSDQNIEFMLRIFNTFPMKNYFPDYNYLGTVCMACIPAN